MSTPLLPTAAQKTVARLDDITANVVTVLTRSLQSYDRAMTQTKADDGKTMLAEADVIAAAGGRLDILPEFIQVLTSALSIANGTAPQS